GVLGALLGEVPVAGHADEVGDDPAPVGPERLVDGGLRVAHISQIGRTSTAPTLTIGTLEATSTASSRSRHSTTKKPAICSLVSAKGPSATTRSPLRLRTVVAALVGRRRSCATRTPRAARSSEKAVNAARSSACSSGERASACSSSPQTSNT